jgi:hypothetical protein
MMPTRKPKSRPAPVRPQPQVNPEQQHEDAMRFLRQEYYGGVRGIVEDLKARVASGEIASEDDLSDAVHQEVDGSYWVIYTHANFQVLLCSDHHDAYFEEYGEAPIVDGAINWAALAFATLERDVRDLMGAEGVEVVEERRRQAREPVPSRAAPGNWGPGIWQPSEARRRPAREPLHRPAPSTRPQPTQDDYRDELPPSMRANRRPRTTRRR